MAVDTTYTSPPTLARAAGQTLPYANYEDLLSDMQHVAGTTGHIGARVYNSSSFSVNNATGTVLTFNSERYDTDPNGNIHSTSVDTGRLTIQTTGKYLVFFTGEYAADPDGYREFAFRLDGITFIAAMRVPALASGVTRIAFGTVYDLNASSYLEVLAEHTAGAALNVVAGGNYSLEFGCAKV